MQHNLGTYNNLKEVWNRYPNGGGHGDYVIIDGEKLYWNELQTSWGDYEYEPEIIRPGIVYEGDIKVEGTGTFHEGIKIGDSIPGYSGALIDEFGNADYRRIDTDSLFIRDEESGNLVSLAKYIVRFKTELPPNWAEYQKLPLFNSARLLLFDGTSESRYYTTIKDLKDAIAAQIEATSGGEGGGSSIVVIRSDDETVAPSDSNVYSALATLRQIDLALQFATGAFLSRVHRDNAEETITFDKGVQFGEYSSNINFGKGGAVDSLGNAELESLVLRSFLEVPELRYNRLTLIGDEIAIGAGGIIEEVEVLEEEVDGVLHEYHRLHMKLEEGEMIPFHISDICKGIYNHGQGFSTSYFSVLSVNQEEQYMDVNVPDSSLVPVNINRPPVKYMNIARWGNFDDPSRQSIIVLSAKTGNIIMYEGLSDYQKVDGTASGGISTQWGKAQGLEFIDDFDDLPIKENDSVLYVKNLLYKNLIKVDFKDNLIVEYRDRGNWSAETAINNPYRATPFMQDEVWHLNSKYRLVHDESTEEPIPSSTHWLLTTTLEVGKTVETYVKYFALSKSNTVAPDEWDTIPQVTTAIYKYLWAYEVTTYTNGDEDVVPPYVTGTYGDTGDSGATVTKTIDYYGVSESEETEPQTWLENEIPPKTPEQYLWNYERIEYSNGYVYETKKHVIQGKDPRSIESIKNQYIYSTSGTVSPSDTANWKDTIASLGARPANSFLWIRDYIDYTDGTHSVTKGRPIKEGSDGYNTATVSLYIRSKKRPTPFSIACTYTFSNGELKPVAGKIGEYGGWHREIIEGEDPLWITSVTIMSREETYQINASAWSIPVIHTEHGGGVDPKNLFSLVKTNDYWGEFCDIIKDQYGTGLFLDTDLVGGNNIPAHVVYEEDQQYSLSLKARLYGNIDYGPSRYIWYMIHLKYEGVTNAITHLVYVHDTQAGFDLEYVMLEYYDSSSDSIQANGAWVDTLPVKRANRYIHVRLKCGFSNGTVSYKGYNAAFNGNRKIERVKLFYRSYAYTSNPTAQIQYWNRVNKRYPVGSPNASSDIDDEEIYLYFKYTDNVTVDQFLPFIDGPLIYLSGVSRRDKTLKSIELSFGRAYTYIYDPMLVKGPKILEFTPAPEDIFNEIETAVDKAAKLPYMAGEWDPTIAYHRTDTYPVVTLTGESNVRYYFLTAVVSLGENPSDNEKIWEYAPDFKMIITEALFSKNAKLGEFIFNGKKMFSQYGDLNGEADNPNYLMEGHKPYFEVDGETGKSKMMDAEIRGTVTTGTKDGERIEISSSNNSISIYDGSGKPTPRALFKPENVPAIGVVESVGGVSDYAIPTYSNEFTSIINDSFYGEYTLVNNTENKLLTFRVPPLNLMVKAIHDPSTNVDSSISVSAILQTPKNQSVFLGYAYAEAGGGQFQESTMTVTTKTEDAIYIGNDSGLFRIRYDVEVRGHKNVPSTFVVAEMDCSPASTSDNRYIVSTNNPTNIYGLDGLVLLNSQNDYLYNNNGLFQVKKGSHGIRVSNTGVEILVNSQWKKVLTQ